MPVDHRHPPAVRDVGDQAQPLGGPATVDPALGEVPAGGDQEDVVQVGQSSGPVCPLRRDERSNKSMA